MAGAVMHVPRTAATIIPYRSGRKRLAEGDVLEAPLSATRSCAAGCAKTPTSRPT